MWVGLIGSLKKKVLLNSPIGNLDNSATSPFSQSSNFSAIKEVI
jgi:hypothetical protein